MGSRATADISGIHKEAPAALYLKSRFAGRCREGEICRTGRLPFEKALVGACSVF